MCTPALNTAGAGLGRLAARCWDRDTRVAAEASSPQVSPALWQSLTLSGLPIACIIRCISAPILQGRSSLPAGEAARRMCERLGCPYRAALQHCAAAPGSALTGSSAVMARGVTA